jgi:trimeric autotransporter adhesin
MTMQSKRAPILALALLLAGSSIHAQQNVTTTGGSAGTIPYFNGTSTVLPSVLHYTSTGLGIGDVPQSALDVTGKMILRGPFDMSRSGDATTSKGAASNPIYFQSSVYNSASRNNVLPYFQLQSEPAGNNTASTSATMNFLYFNGGATSETGLYINSNGTIHFATAQTFPVAAGPQGPAGPTGPKGATGATGATGPQGPTGPAGGLTLPFYGSASGGSGYVFNITNTDGESGGGISGTGSVAFSSNGYSGGIGIRGTGGNSTSTAGTAGGLGVAGTGGNGTATQTFGGPGGNFQGGSTGSGGYGAGEGLVAYGGSANTAHYGGYGIFAAAGSNGDYAAYLAGNVYVSGNLAKSGGSFKIDDPIDPENKYLYHSFVESPDMKNIYDGNVVTDGSGTATVTMPDYFEALNTDFRYQLTAIGQFSQAIVASKIANGSFTIRTDKPHVEVSWQVTGVRQDAWANAHRIPVEEEKLDNEKGHYLHPELFGHNEEAAIGTKGRIHPVQTIDQ